MSETIQESRICHRKTKKPLVLLKQNGSKYFVETLNYAGTNYEQLRKNGKYSDLQSYDKLDDADTDFRMTCLKYEM